MPYDEDRLLAEVRLLIDWYLPAVTGRPTAETTAAAFIEAWRRTLAPVALVHDTLVLRDYHADNLMWLAERAGSARVGLLDFRTRSPATRPTIWFLCWKTRGATSRRPWPSA